MLSWEADATKICEIIESTTSSLKIVLKIQDDFDMFDEFLEHHCRIVGYENLYIFDNNSTNEKLLERYKNFAPSLNVFRFGGFHNNIHSPESFAPLYESLKKSSTHYTFLDSDERMYYVESDNWISDSRIISYLNGKGSIPGIWLSNAKGSKEIFNINLEQDELEKGTAWGKPIFSSSDELTGFLNHNIQAIDYIKNNLEFRQIFILHLNNLSPKQRIEANIRKLVARGFVQKDATPDDVISARQATYEDQNIAFYVEEIATLHTTPASITKILNPGQISFSSSGQINFFSDTEKRILAKFLEKKSTFVYPKPDNTGINLTLLKYNDDSEELSYSGHIDANQDGRISGWAIDNHGNECSIRIIVNGSEHAIIHTISNREDLRRSNLSNGKGGFEINLKDTLKQNKNLIQILFFDGRLMPNGNLEVKW